MKTIRVLILMAWVWLTLPVSVSAFYNPSTGRWLNRDPIEEKGGLSLYGFAGNAPAIRVDRDGRQEFPLDPNAPHPDYCAMFEEWYKKEKANMSWMDGLPSCPCTLVFVCRFIFLRPLNPDSAVWKDPSSAYQGGAEWNMRSKPIASGARNECSYDRNGKLITHGAGAGTVDRGGTGLRDHIKKDWDPYTWARNCGGDSVNKYLEVRPIENGNNCPKNP